MLCVKKSYKVDRESEGFLGIWKKWDRRNWAELKQEKKTWKTTRSLGIEFRRTNTPLKLENLFGTEI